MKKWLTSSQFDNGQTSRFSIFTIFLMIKLHPKILQEHSHSFRFNFTNIEANIWAKSFHERFCKNSSQCREILLQVKYAMASFRCYDNSDVIVFLIMKNFHLYLIKLWWQFFPNVCLWRRSYSQNWEALSVKNCYSVEPPPYVTTAYVVASYGPLFLSTVRFFKFWATCENFLGKSFTAPPPPLAKISRTPMATRHHNIYKLNAKFTSWPVDKPEMKGL